MPILTNEQRMAQKAYGCVASRAETDFSEYKSFALAFPALIHSCGLAQAMAFAVAKNGEFVKDLQEVFQTVDEAGDLCVKSREAELSEYMRITRHAIAAASWLKRCCQALDNKKAG